MQDKIFNPNAVGLRNGHFIGLPFSEQEAQLVLFPVPWEVTVSYSAKTAHAPDYILGVSPQLDLHDEDVPNAWQMGIYQRPLDRDWLDRNYIYRKKASDYIEYLESGGLIESEPYYKSLLDKINQACEDLKAYVCRETSVLLDEGKIVGLIGGDHSTPLGYLQALAERNEAFGILQIDAHCDLRAAYEGFTYSHASIFYNALQLPAVTKLVQVGIRDYCEEEAELIHNSQGRVQMYSDAQLRRRMFAGASFQKISEEIIHHLPEKVYISFDIDGLNPTMCPNTGTPVPGGLEFHEAMFLIKTIVDSGRTIIGFDLCETGVPTNGSDWDGNVAARILYKMANLTGKSQGKI